jgi:hypothetical protein
MAMFRPCGVRGVCAPLRSGAHSSSRPFSCGVRALNGGLGAPGARMDGRRPALARAGRRFSAAARPYPDNDGRPERVRLWGVTRHPSRLDSGRLATAKAEAKPGEGSFPLSSRPCSPRDDG